MEAMSLVATFADLNEEYVEDVCENDQCNLQEADPEITLNDWYEKTICSFVSGKTVSKNFLSDHEIEYVQKHNLITAVDVTYLLLGKYTTKNHEEQIGIVLDVLAYLGNCRLPKEYLGGFLILMIKYHFLP
jgi:hypothetical protein